MTPTARSTLLRGSDLPSSIHTDKSMPVGLIIFASMRSLSTRTRHDTLIGTSELYKLNHKLLDDPACIGPRGLHNGGCLNPANAEIILPFARKIDFPGRVWIIMCHDEACVHTLKGERCCWMIPGVDMGDIPPKSDGEFEHLGRIANVRAGVSPWTAQWGKYLALS